MKKIIMAAFATLLIIGSVSSTEAKTKANEVRIHTSNSETLSARRHRHASRHHRRVALDAHSNRARGVSLVGIVSSELIAKVREIQAACGSIVVSARSHRGNRSNHPIGRAADLQGNPSCIYAHLQGWPGGKSSDYSSAPGGPHVHISYNPGGQEWGLTFAHNHGHHYAYSARQHRHHRRYASR